MNSSVVSIIIPAYNAAAFLDQTLETVISQTCAAWELLIIDDGSQDETYSLAQSWASRDSRIHAYHKDNGGVATARNYGFERTHPASEYLIFLDHDDVWEPDALENLVGALAAMPEAVAAHGLARRSAMSGPSEEILGGGRRKLVQRVGWIYPVVCSREEPTTFAVLAYDGCLCTPGMVLIRRSAIGGMPFFQQELAPSDDFDFWVRLSLRGPFAFIHQVVIEWRQHETNVSGDARLMADALARNRSHVLRLPELSPEQRRLAFWRYQRMYSSIIRHNALDYQEWALESLRRRRLGDAVRYGSAAVSCYFQYLRLRLFWRNGQDRGPLPARLKDQQENNERAVKLV